ncbi:MAG: glycosyltransferase [Candidatus Schekmanbacteria bacterium]|nr:glycosyltransferase [Candidatus Schekmanbacteria bacterium]
MSCSVIIRCFNEEEHIGRLLSGLMLQTVTGVEIIVVDSGSTDATLSIVERFPATVCHIAPADFSFGRSLNIGCEAAHHELLVVASAHVYPIHTTWLESLLAPFADPAVEVAYGRQCGDWRTRFSEEQIFRKWFPARSLANQTTPFCNNANAAVRRATWRRLRYDESLTGLEDIELACRVLRDGGRIAYSAEAVVAHVHQETARRIYNRYRREAMALKRIFPEQHMTSLEFLQLLGGNVASDLYHAYQRGRLLATASDIVRFRFMQFTGTASGFAQMGAPNAHLKETLYYPNRLDSAADGHDERHSDARIDYARIMGKD